MNHLFPRHPVQVREWKVGDKVMHTRFGKTWAIPGTIISITGNRCIVDNGSASLGMHAVLLSDSGMVLVQPVATKELK